MFQQLVENVSNIFIIIGRNVFPTDPLENCCFVIQFYFPVCGFELHLPVISLFVATLRHKHQKHHRVMKHPQSTLLLFLMFLCPLHSPLSSVYSFSLDNRVLILIIFLKDKINFNATFAQDRQRQNILSQKLTTCRVNNNNKKNSS